MSTTPRNQLALLAAGQAQKEVTHNEALVAIDRLLNPSVKTRALSSPPAAPTLGESWIVGGGPTGAWLGQEDAIAVFEGDGWAFVSPKPGLVAFVEDEGSLSVWRGEWSSGWPVSQFALASTSAVTLPVGGAVADEELRQSFGSLVSALQAVGLIS